MSRAFTKERDGEPERAIVVERLEPLEVTREGLERIRRLAAEAGDPQKRAELEARAAAAIVPAAPDDPRVVAFGATVTVRVGDTGRRERFVLVGDDEIDVARGRVGTPSPLGVALLGRRTGDTVLWQRPAGNEHLTVEAIDYDELGG